MGTVVVEVEAVDALENKAIESSFLIHVGLGGCLESDVTPGGAFSMMAIAEAASRPKTQLDEGEFDEDVTTRGWTSRGRSSGPTSRVQRQKVWLSSPKVKDSRVE